MEGAPPPSRLLLVVAGTWTQLVGAAYLVLALASLPVAHDLHAGTHSLIASIVAALAAVVCGTLVYRGRLVPLALAAGLDVGFGIGLPRGSSAVGSILRVLPATDAGTAEALVTAGAIAMFAAAIACVIAIPAALKLRAWARGELARGAGGASRSSFPAGVEPGGRTPSGEISPGASAAKSTLRGLGPAKLVPTQVLQIGERRGKPLVIIGVAVSLIALGVVIIGAATSDDAEPPQAGSGQVGSGSSGNAAGTGSGTELVVAPLPAIDAAVAPAIDAAPELPPVDELVARFHAALAADQAAPLALVFDTHAFTFGTLANEVAEGRDAVVGTLLHDLGPAPPPRGLEVTPRFSQVAHDGDVAWAADEVEVGAQTFEITFVAGISDHAWTIAALQVAFAMPNDTAYRLGRDGQLAVPDAIPDTHDASDLAKAMREAFASKPSFVAARSSRADAFNFGSAPGERTTGGDAIKKLFLHLRATMRLHGAVKVGAVGAAGGWGAANVDFTDADKDGTPVTQTFRVLAAWVREGSDWRIVQTQFSNPR